MQAKNPLSGIFFHEGGRGEPPYPPYHKKPGYQGKSFDTNFLEKDLASLGSNAYVVSVQNEYEINFNKFQNGEISETEWREFCDKVMDKVLADTKDVFERLKVR